MKRGITLVELLVVVAILGLLGAMFAPGILRGMERAEEARCLANLRAMGQAVQVYVLENEGQYPPALVSEGGVKKGWDFFIDGGGEVEPGWIWREYGVNEILQCPTFAGDANWRDSPYTGYNYNSSYLGGMRLSVRGRVIREVPSATAAQVADPARTAVFGDGEYGEGANKFMRSPRPGLLDADFSGRHGGTQGFRHGGGTQVVFADGRATRIGERAVPAGMEGMVGSGTGFLSEDNSMYGGE